jgi:hypothetical protein
MVLQINTVPPEEAHVFYGALIGGPDVHDNFYDLRDGEPRGRHGQSGMINCSFRQITLRQRSR